MARELSRSERRLLILGVFALFWGAFLVSLGVALPLVAIVLGAAAATAVVAVGAPRLLRSLRPHAGRVGRRLAGGGRAADAAALHGLTAVSARAGRIDWARQRASLRAGAATAAACGRAADAVALRGLRAVSARIQRIDWAAHRASVLATSTRAVARGRATDAATLRTLRAAAAHRNRVDWSALRTSARAYTDAALQRGRHATTAVRASTAALRRTNAERQPPSARLARSDALRLNEQAAALRQEGRTREAFELCERALAIFRELGDAHGEALTLNGLGLTQARLGDEAGALDSYEKAIALLTDLGDSHGAGRVLANLGVLHRVHGHDEQARAVWHDALERLEPGTPEHDRTAEQLRLAS